MFQLETENRLRIVVQVPEADVGGIVKGGKIEFSVPAYPGETFYGTLNRIARSIDPKTRSMPVELDVSNPGGKLAAGRYANVERPMRADLSRLSVSSHHIDTATGEDILDSIEGGAGEMCDGEKSPRA